MKKVLFGLILVYTPFGIYSAQTGQLVTPNEIQEIRSFCMGVGSSKGSFTTGPQPGETLKQCIVRKKNELIKSKLGIESEDEQQPEQEYVTGTDEDDLLKSSW